MKKSLKLFVFGISAIVFVAGCSTREESVISTCGSEIIFFRALPFGLTDVKLLEGPFLHATELNMKILLNYEPDRLLSKFYSEAGLKPKAEHYLGWEDESLAGHSLGHYLSGCSIIFFQHRIRKTGMLFIIFRWIWAVLKISRIRNGLPAVSGQEWKTIQNMEGIFSIIMIMNYLCFSLLPLN